MKKLFIPVLAGLAICCTSEAANAQEFKTHVSKAFTVSGSTANTLSIYNLEGYIKVEGYSGDKVMIEVDETISARNDEQLEIGKKEFKLEFEQNKDSITAYIAEPYDSRPHQHWNDFDDRRNQYRYKLEFTVKVPAITNLVVSTINNGHIDVKDVGGLLHINNVNGPITIANAKGTTHAHTVNGGVTVNYISNPPAESSFYTINGEIKVTYQPNLSADLQFKSMNGEFFTDFKDLDILPAKIKKTHESNGATTTYKLGATSEVRIGAGGSSAKFETLNGNIYIKKQS
jgi:hypothetical protein